MKAHVTILISLLLASFNVIAQADSLKIDSLKRVLLTEKEDTSMVNSMNKLADLLGDDFKYEEAYSYSIKSLSLADKISYTYGAGFAHYLVGSYMEVLPGVNEEEFSQIFGHLSTAQKVFENFKDKQNLANCYKSLGYAYYLVLKDIPDAMNYMYKALGAYEKVHDDENISDVFSFISSIRSLFNDDAGTVENLSASINMLRNVKKAWAIEEVNVMMAELLIRQKRYTEALEKLSIAMKVYKDSTFQSSDQVYLTCLNKIGEIYEKIGDSALISGNISLSTIKYKEAAVKYTEGYTSLKSNSSMLEYQSYQLSLIGKIYLKMGRLKEARILLESSLKEADSLRQKLISREAHLTLFRLDSLEGNYKASLEQYKKYIQLRDTLANNETDKKILQVKLQYEFDGKQALAKGEQAKKDAEAKRIKNQQYFAIGALGIVVLAVVIIAIIQFRSNKHKQQANLALQRQKEKVESTLSELKSTQAQLIQSEKMASLGELTAGIAHEIQNPLNFVNNFSEVNKELLVELNNEIEKGNYDDAKAITKDVIDNSEKINHHGKRAGDIVKGMLEHSKASTGKKESTDINKLVDEYLRLSYHGMRAKDKDFNATIKMDFDESIGKINIIPQDIGRVLLNLYNNAFYATNEKAKTADGSYTPLVSIQTKKLNEKVEIKVTDNGNGIPQNIIDKIFQPFFTTKPTGQGTGLGLSLSYDIIKAHGGEIKVETKEGEGGEFIIQLPIV